MRKGQKKKKSVHSIMNKTILNNNILFSFISILFTEVALFKKLNANFLDFILNCIKLILI